MLFNSGISRTLSNLQLFHFSWRILKILLNQFNFVLNHLSTFQSLSLQDEIYLFKDKNSRENSSS